MTENDEHELYAEVRAAIAKYSGDTSTSAAMAAIDRVMRSEHALEFVNLLSEWRVHGHAKFLNEKMEKARERRKTHSVRNEQSTVHASRARSVSRSKRK